MNVHLLASMLSVLRENTGCVHDGGVEVSQMGFIRSESIGSLPLTVILAIIHSETEDNHGFAVSDDSLPTATHLLDHHSIGNSQSPAPTKDIPGTHLHNHTLTQPHSRWSPGRWRRGSEHGAWSSVGVKEDLPPLGRLASAEGCPRLMAGPPVE